MKNISVANVEKKTCILYRFEQNRSRLSKLMTFIDIK